MNKRIKGALAGAAAICSLAVAGAAQATIVDINSQSSTGVTITLQPGAYKIEFIGTADGGAYNAWNPSCPGGVCPASGWRDVFSVTNSNEPPGWSETFFVAGPAYTSALNALAGFQSSDITGNSFDAAFNLIDTEIIHQPWLVAPQSPTTITFFIRDNTRDDNVGGVSLRISAVPEPATWLTMILGFAGIGAALRRHRRQLAAA